MSMHDLGPFRTSPPPTPWHREIFCATSAYALIARPVSHSHDRATQCLARRPRRTTDVHRAPPRRTETLGQTSRDSAKQVCSWVENEMGTGGDRVSTSTGPVAGRVLAEQNQCRLASPAPPPHRRPGSGLTGASATGDRTMNSELRVATWRLPDTPFLASAGAPPRLPPPRAPRVLE